MRKCKNTRCENIIKKPSKKIFCSDKCRRQNYRIPKVINCARPNCLNTFEVTATQADINFAPLNVEKRELKNLKKRCLFMDFKTSSTTTIISYFLVDTKTGFPHLNGQEKIGGGRRKNWQKNELVPLWYLFFYLR